MHSKTISNVFFSASYQILILFVPLITTPYITRIFSPSQLGIYAASLALVGFFVVGAAFGLPFFGSREISKASPENRTLLFYEFFSLQILTSIAFFISFIIMITIVGSSKYYYIQSLLILINIFDISWFYIGIEEIKRTLYRNFISKMFTLISIFIFVKSKNDLLVYIIINILGMLLGNLLMIMQLKKFINTGFKFVFPKLSTFKGSFGLFVSQMISSSKSSFDRIILVGMTGSNSAVGIYDQGRKIINIIIAVSNSATIALLPKMTSTIETSEGNTDKLESILKKVIPIIFLGSLFLGYSINLNAVSFVRLFFGQGYENVATILKIFSIVLLILPVNYFLLNGVILPKSEDKQYRKIYIISAVVLLLGNLVLDKSFDFVGAASAFLVSEFVIFFYIVWLLKKEKSFKLFFLPFIFTCLDYAFFVVTGNLLTNHLAISGNFFVVFLYGAMVSSIYFVIMHLIIFIVARLIIKYKNISKL